jgi:putative transposase
VAGLLPHSLCAHLAFVASYRWDALDQEMLTACERVMRGLCAEMDADLPELNSEPDHIHLLFLHRPRLRFPRSSTPQRCLADHLRKEFTGRASRHLIRGHLRSSSYLTASCGEAPTEIIKQYAEQQKQPGQTDAISSALNKRESPHHLVDTAPGRSLR